MGVFSKEHNPETSIKRNTFPQSFCNNLTFNFGEIIPFACFETMSGDTFELQTAFGLRFWPTAFPLQSRIRADIHWLYVRKRNLYNEYKEFYTGGTVEKKMPYLANLKPDDFKNGSLFDYFNIPTTVVFSAGDEIFEPEESSFRIIRNRVPSLVYLPDGRTCYSKLRPTVGGRISISWTTSYPSPTWVSPSNTDYVHSNGVGVAPNTDEGVTQFGEMVYVFRATSPWPVSDFTVSGFTPQFRQYMSTNDLTKLGAAPLVTLIFTYRGVTYYVPVICGDCIRVSSGIQDTVDSFTYSFSWNKIAEELGLPSGFEKDAVWGSYSFNVGLFLFPLGDAPTLGVFSQDGETEWDFTVTSSISQSVELCNLSPDKNPFLVSSAVADRPQNGFQVPLNALPFRAYEQIYNSFFRDERNNPLVINGKPYYDKYLRTTDGGADTERYELHRRNWEQDFLTTALPSPQQGEAPLVGISPTGVMTLADENGNTYQAQAITADDNDTIIGAKFLSTNQDGTSVPGNVARSLVSYATSGISINDFRNVNALQRYLETNLRRGLKYRDLVAARWGVNISYSEMNMPEFIGGATEYVTPSQVNQTSQDTSDSPLGSYAGQLHCQGSQKHKIRHFCDEDGYIIGLVSVVPVPVYSQLLPKMFTKFDPLDFYQPEFGHIGMQPIPMKEVAPLQVALANGNQNETFGYQRAWYDYLARVDEVHGDMRGSLRDYVMYRTFSGIPRLGKDFLLVDHKPLDNVFTVQKDADGNSVDKIIGQIYVDAVTRRPIPRFGIPRLE